MTESNLIIISESLWLKYLSFYNRRKVKRKQDLQKKCHIPSGFVVSVVAYISFNIAGNIAAVGVVAA